MQPTPDLSVIVPAYQEARRIGPSLQRILDYLRRQAHAWELIVVDDGSQDGTAQVVQTLFASCQSCRLLGYTPNRGKGYAVRTGVLASRGQWVVFLDADLSTPVEEVDKALAHLRDGWDVVIGSRAHPESKIVVRQPLHRRAATAIFDVVKHLLVGLWQFSDTQCGFKAYRGEVARALFGRARVERFMFDVEILFLAERAGLRVREIPIRWADATGSKVRFLEGGVNMVRDLLRIRWHHRGAVKL